MKLRTSAFAVALLAGAFAAFSLAAEKEQAKAQLGKPAPSFSLEDQNGSTVNIDDYKGKIIVLEWFNDGCPFVQRHYEKLNTMNTLAEQYKDKDVVWLAIDTTRGHDAAHNKKSAEKWSINHPILNDSAGKVGALYGAKATPHMFIIDKDGKLAYKGGIDNDPDGNKGDSRVNYVQKALDELLAGTEVSTPETQEYGCSVKYGR